MSTYQSFEQDLKLLQLEVHKYNQNLNDSGIWLFLATLGCWSVNEPTIRLIAAACTFILFSHKLMTGVSDFKLFTTKIKEQTLKIEASSLDEKSKKALKFDLLNFEKEQSSSSRIIKKVPAYYVSMLFLLASLIHWRWNTLQVIYTDFFPGR
ncbi:hypothetical protein [Plesiomonas shigelloides]|uniref:hypothetical protein n=1 Tax=Plesiomonas shigelloides TaxID=703 RepID=UPI0012614847|nr:hypothetical protein [Plesiomonas shigelloides]KAB7697141.1 hypothetical protein GBN15_08460 [Plesiomonas shigelloides]